MSSPICGTAWKDKYVLTAIAYENVSQHNECTTTQWMYHNTMNVSQHNECTTTQWMYHNTINVPQHNECTTKLRTHGIPNGVTTSL